MGWHGGLQSMGLLNTHKKDKTHIKNWKNLYVTDKLFDYMLNNLNM